MKKKILLIQPRHIYAPTLESNKLGHIYMPVSLLSAAAIFLKIGFEVEFVDENISKADISNNIIGINLLGAPYIPEALKIENRLKEIYDNDYTLLLGGQIINGLTGKELSKIFSNQTFNGNSSSELSKIFDIELTKIPKIEDLSLINSYKLLKDNNLKMYLEREFTFYLSQGCKYSCSFCSAERTIINKELGIKKIRSERYRNINIALSDLEFLIKKALSFKIYNLSFYLSNLDIFQTPLKVHRFGLGIIELKKKYPEIVIKFRGLSTSRSFIKTHNKYPYIIMDLVKAGLKQVGFGIDGATPKVYKETRKPQTVKESLDVIRISKEVYNLVPEILMVFGHNDKEDEDSLLLALKFCLTMQKKYNARPRPHVAKDIVPGNDGWYSELNESKKNEFLENPTLFQNLDFTATPSPITHPDLNFRNLVEKTYIEVCELPNSLTQYVKPYLPKMKKEEYQKICEFNKGRYDI